MTAKLSDNRLALSMVFSLLLHSLVFFSVILLIQFNKIKPEEEKKAASLQVRLAQLLPPKVQPKPGIKLLSTLAPAPFKIAQAPVQTPPDNTPKPPAPVDEQAAPAAGKVEGVSFPGSVATPFAGQAHTSNPFSMQARGAQQEAARAYYQRGLEAQSRQRSEFQAQLMLQQLQQLLSKQLDVEPAVSGKCVLVEAADSVNHRLKCDSSALYEVISNNQKNVVAMLVALRGMGRIFNGFSVEIHKNKPLISIN